jgi:hypothetical protein
MKEYFPEPDATKEWIKNPFATISQTETFTNSSYECDMLVNLASDGALKVVFSEKSLPYLSVYVWCRYSELSDRATKHLLPF